MSQSPRAIEEVVDSQMEDVQDETPEDESLPIDETATDEATTGPAKKKEKKAPAALHREPGKTLFPISKVQKIIKLDKEIPIVAKDATLAIALATEMFIEQLCQAGYSVARGENRSTIQPKDLTAIISRADEFLFLEDTLTWLFQEPVTKKTTKSSTRKDKEVVEKGNISGPMDQFMGNKEANGDGYLINEDGTISAVANDFQENDFESD